MNRHGPRNLVAASVLALAVGAIVAGSGSIGSSGPGRSELPATASNPIGPTYRAGSSRHPEGHAASSSSAAQAKSDPVAVALDHLRSDRSLTGGHPAGDFRVARSSRASASGQTIVRFDQVQDGIPVFAGEVVIAVDPTKGVVATNAETMPGTVATANPAVSRAHAVRLALAATTRKYGAGASAGATSLTVLDPELIGSPTAGGRGLAWRVAVRRERPSLFSREVFVDAVSGQVRLSLNRLAAAAPALNRRVCDARSTSGAVPCTNPVRVEGGAPSDINDVNYAYDYAGDTWDFFRALGRDSLDDKGMTLTSTVRYCEPGNPCPWRNAQWDGVTNQMVYGAGYPRGDDVVAHELTHGVTQFSSNLAYYYQSGAINEGLSDVFGEFVDLTNGQGTDTSGVRWQIGEDTPGGMIRDMSDPAATDQPDRTGSSLYDPDSSFSDDGGVHTNSGIVNKAAVLIADGGDFNGQTITGIDSGDPDRLSKSAAIWYQASQLLTSGADFQQLGAVLDSACRSLVGKGDISNDDCAQVDKAVVATEMDTTPRLAPINKAPVCTSGGPIDVWSDGFEGGPDVGAWQRSSSTGPTRWYWSSENPGHGQFASSGSQNLWGVDGNTVSDSSIAMTEPVLIPAGAFLRFEHVHDFEVTDGHLADGGVVEYSINDGASWSDSAALMTNSGYNGTIDSGSTIPSSERNPLKSRRAFVGTSTGYKATRLDLSSLAGKSARFRFRIGTDDGNGGGKATGEDYMGWFIDNARIYSCDQTLDTNPPAVERFVPVTSGPTNATSVTYRVTFTEPVAGLSAGDFIVKGSSSGWTVGAISGSGAGPYTVTLNASGGTGGSLGLTLGVSAVSDAASNLGPVAGVDALPLLVIDRSPPDTRITSGPTSGSRPGFKFSSPATDVKSYQCRFDSGAWGTCSSPYRRASSLSRGNHVFQVRALDRAGNLDPTPARKSFRV